jgi:hypothetical protein
MFFLAPDTPASSLTVAAIAEQRRDYLQPATSDGGSTNGAEHRSPGRQGKRIPLCRPRTNPPQSLIPILAHSVQPAATIFKLIRYDPNTDTSVLHCESRVA